MPSLNSNLNRIVFQFFFSFMMVITGCDEIFSEDNNHSQKASEWSTVQYPVNDSINTLSIDQPNGSIQIIGTQLIDSISVEYEKVVKASSKAEAAAHLDDIVVTISQIGSNFYIHVDHPNGSERNYELNLFVTIPDHWLTDLNLANGSIELENMAQDSQINLANGDLAIHNLVGNLDISLANGSLAVQEHTGNLNCQLVNGQISVHTSLIYAGECIISLTNGNMHVHIPPSTSATVELSVQNGAIIHSGLPLVISTQSDHFLQGQLGDGSGSIDLNAGNGNIFLRNLD